MAVDAGADPQDRVAIVSCLFREITGDLDSRRRAEARTATLVALAVHGGTGRAKLPRCGTFSDVEEVFADQPASVNRV